MQNQNLKENYSPRLSKRTFLLRVLKHHILPIIFAAVLIVVIMQLLYPHDRVLPLKTLNGDLLSGLKKDELKNYLYNRYYDVPLNVSVHDSTVKSSIGKAGIQPNYETTAHNVLHYPLAERFIPFSFLFHSTEVLETEIDTVRAKLFITELQKACAREPKSASVKVSGDAIELVPAQNGSTCPEDKIQKALNQLDVLPDGSSLAIEPVVVKPIRSNADVEPKVSEAKKVIDRGLTLVLPNENRVVSKADLATFIAFDEHPETKIITVSINPSAIEKYLLPLEKEIYEAPGTTVKTLRDGIETAVTYGGYGKGINVPITTSNIKDVLTSESTTTVQVTLADLSPRTVINRTYSNTQVGLEVLLQDLTREKGNYSIAVMELYGQQRVASSNTNKSYVTASTYKMFVAHSVLKSIEAGKIGWGDSISNGRNTDQCLNDMIVLSDNLCAIEFGNKVGWANIERQMHDLGLSSTFFRLNGRPDNITTSSDEALFLKKLQTGESLQGASRDKLLSLMKRQVYRSGIPKGTGYSVADKIGFLDSYLHDAGIVYGPKGAYVIVVLTNGGSWGGIADSAKRINNFLQQ